MSKRITKAMNDEAIKIAKENGYDDPNAYVASISEGLQSSNSNANAKAVRAAGELVSKLTATLYDQTFYDNLGTSSVYTWVRKFSTSTLYWGNSKQLAQTVLTGAGMYDPNLWVPNNATNPQLTDTFLISFLKPDKSDSTTSYKYKKSLTLQPHNWSYYFLSGKMEELIAKIRSEMSETYELFIAQKFQQYIKTLASETAQTTIANAGENGVALRLKTITSTATDTFQAMLDFMYYLDDIINDVNKYTIATDSTNIRPINKSDLIIFVPKKLKAKFRSGILSRLPSSGEFNYDKIFSTDTTFISGRELNTVMSATGNTTTITIMDTPFLTEDKIVVMEKEAILHVFVNKSFESQYYGENMNTQLTHHQWGFFGINPFKRGFVFKCTNLLTDPNTP